MQRDRRTTVRTLVGLVVGAVVAAGIALAVMPAQAEPVVVAPAPVAAPRTAPPATPVVATTPTHTAAPTHAAVPSHSATPKRSRTSTAPPRQSTSCAEAAMQAGRFDPSCDEYQGYLDPGTAAGRAPTSGETQMQWACEQGLVPQSEC